jgi:nitroimidazol reductase NimA-like FMN-containing flavoprotein (pyridoxamine 5'-phosphate oxidase superfamily)
MALVDSRNWLEILSNEECWRLVASSTVGRLAVIGDDGSPEIYPLNIATDGQSVVFRTDPGSKLAALQKAPRVALEVDGLDFEACDGWSVLLVGPVEELGGTELIDAQRLPLAPWAIGEKARWFRLTPTRVTGRGIGDRARRRTATPKA